MCAQLLLLLMGLFPGFVVLPEELYVSDREGNDSSGDGTQKKPFKTVLKVTPRRETRA